MKNHKHIDQTLNNKIKNNKNKKPNLMIMMIHNMISSQDKNKLNSIKITEKLDNKSNSYLKMLEKEDLIKLSIGLNLLKLHNKSYKLSRSLTVPLSLMKLLINLDFNNSLKKQKKLYTYLQILTNFKNSQHSEKNTS